MAKKDATATVEREYTIPLRKGFRSIVSHKKTPRAVREIILFLKKHTKAKEIKLGMHLNEHVWKHGSKNPPGKVRVHAVIRDGIAKAELAGKSFKEAVKAKEKKAPKNLKEKLEAKLGVDSPKAEEHKKLGSANEEEKPKA
jgi:large subunit ribosomal protein L31e